jgi:hypothetical protein
MHRRSLTNHLRGVRMNALVAEIMPRTSYTIQCNSTTELVTLLAEELAAIGEATSLSREGVDLSRTR